MSKFNDSFKQLPGLFVPDDCTHGVGSDGMCPYKEHDDDFCLECLKDIRAAITKEIRKLNKELKQ